MGGWGDGKNGEGVADAGSPNPGATASTHRASGPATPAFPSANASDRRCAASRAISTGQSLLIAWAAPGAFSG